MSHEISAAAAPRDHAPPEAWWPHVRAALRGQHYDYTEGPVPMPDATGVVHARPALRAWSRCQPHGPSLFGNTPVTTSLYAKLRAREREPDDL